MTDANRNLSRSALSEAQHAAKWLPAILHDGGSL
jgi:hypothetical protein